MIRKDAAARSERRRKERSDRVLDAAMRLLVEEGAHALTIQRLAHDLDYAVGALYRYFPSKDALLADLQRKVIHELRITTSAQCRAAREPMVD